MRPFRIIQDRWSFKIHAGLIPGGKVSWLETLLCGQVQVPPLTVQQGSRWPHAVSHLTSCCSEPAMMQSLERKQPSIWGRGGEKKKKRKTQNNWCERCSEQNPHWQIKVGSKWRKSFGLRLSGARMFREGVAPSLRWTERFLSSVSLSKFLSGTFTSPVSHRSTTSTWVYTV